MKSFIKQQPLLSYFVLAYGLSWIIWVPVGWVVNRVDEPPEWVFLLVILGIYGASGAGFIMTGLVDGKPGVRKLLARVRNWRVGFQWYLVAFLVVPLLILAGMALYTFLGNPTGPFVPSRLPMLLLGAIPAIFFGAFWSSIILGILHTFWHTPLFFIGGVTFGTIGENGLVTVPLFLSWVTIGTFVYTLLSNNTAASMLMAILFHWNVNISNDIVFGMFPALPEPAQFQIMTLAQIPGWIVVVLLIVVFGPARLSRKSAPREPSPSG
jgi:hypothetical protein